MKRTHGKNLQGDITAIHNTSGTAVVTYVHDAWGKAISVTGTLAGTVGAANPYRHKSYYYDTDTGLYYLQSRYYDAQVQRFVSPDMPELLGVSGGIYAYNLYTYCENDPVNNVDESGHFWISILLTSIALGTCVVMISGCTNSNVKPIIKYNVPLYKQGKTNLCWAYCQVMIEGYKNGTKYSKKQADARAKEIAIARNGAKNWNRGGWPSDLGERIGSNSIKSINDIYSILKNNGPVYAYYSNATEAHLVVITVVDLNKGIIYTNNPWGVSGSQNYEQFKKGFAIKWWHKNTKMSFNAIYLIKNK